MAVPVRVFEMSGVDIKASDIKIDTERFKVGLPRHGDRIVVTVNEQTVGYEVVATYFAVSADARKPCEPTILIARRHMTKPELSMFEAVAA